MGIGHQKTNKTNRGYHLKKELLSEVFGDLNDELELLKAFRYSAHSR